MTRRTIDDFLLVKISSVPPEQMTRPAAPPPDVYEQLRKLGELRDLGIVTPEEFEEKKRQLLSRI